MPTLGLLARIAYDSGEVEDLSFVGFGMRSVAWDARRRRVYLTRFFRGEIVAVDADSGKEVGRWFVGRFPCQVRLARDGRSLLAGTTAGVVRIRLDET